MGLAEYRAQILEWQKTYGVPSRAFRYDPTETEASCRKCGKMRKRMSRHHISHDLRFAVMRPDLYAARYIQFRKEDTAKLCSNCHTRVHEYYMPMLEQMRDELADRSVNPKFKGRRELIVSEEWCEKWRAVFKEAFEKWVATPPRRKLKRKKK